MKRKELFFICELTKIKILNKGGKYLIFGWDDFIKIDLLSHSLYISSILA